MNYLKYTLIVFLVMSLTNCVQKRHLKTVTFKLDMSNVENLGQVGIRGNFTNNSWRETVYMSDDDKDSIYELTLERETAFNSIEFKFVNQDEEFELEGQDNRTITFEYKPETIVYEAVFNEPNGKQTSIKP